MTARKCSCDACASDAVANGLCVFCADACYPQVLGSGISERVAMTRATRLALHGRTVPRPPVIQPPVDIRVHVARAAVEALAPAVERGSRAIVRALRRRIRGG